MDLFEGGDAVYGNFGGGDANYGAVGAVEGVDVVDPAAGDDGSFEGQGGEQG